MIFWFARDIPCFFIGYRAVVRGSIHAVDADNVVIRGHGILDGGYFAGDKQSRTLVLEHCRHARLEDIIIINPPAWTVIIAICDDVVVRNLKEIGFEITSDGIDIVGSTHVLIEGCFLHNGDDVIVIKSLDMHAYWPKARYDWRCDVHDIEVRGCTLSNHTGGSAMEIGGELRTASIRDIIFRDGLYYDNQRITDLAELEIYSRFAENIQLR